MGIDAEASIAFPAATLGQGTFHSSPKVLLRFGIFFGGEKIAFCFPIGQIVSCWDGRDGLDSKRDLFTGMETPRVKRIPPHRHAAGMGFKAPAGKKLSGNGEEKKLGKKGPRHGAAGLGRAPCF